MLRSFFSFCLFIACSAFTWGDFTVEATKEKARIYKDKKLVMDLVLRDEKIFRPYFARLHSPAGVQLTRNHPPDAGDPTDHADMHPGLWLAFGKLSGFDYWRNKTLVRNMTFDLIPTREKDLIRFKIINHYLKGPGREDKVLCREVSTFHLAQKGKSYFLDWNAEFTPNEDLIFGDQEEMGLGVRVNTLISVRKGGTINNQEGGVNEKGTWGKTSTRCEYWGKVDGKSAGIAIVPNPGNFRPSWFHSRDYGLMVANPFGRKSFNKGEESHHKVAKGEKFILSFQVELFDR